MINFTRNGKRNTRLFYKENIWLKDKVNRTCFYFFEYELTVFGKVTKIFAWVWKIMILSRCLDAKRSPFVVMRDQLSSGWQEIVVDNKFHIAWSKLISSKCLNILTMHWQHTSLNSEMIFLNIETLRLDHWFHTQLNIYKNISFKCQIKNLRIWNYPAGFRRHISLSVVFNLTTLSSLYIMLILIQVMKM